MIPKQKFENSLKKVEALEAELNLQKETQKEYSEAIAELCRHAEETTEALLRANRKLKAEIEARKRSEEALREEKERYRTLFEGGMRDALFVHKIREGTSFGKFSEVNHVACERLGYTREELLGLSPHDINAPDFQGEIQTKKDELLGKGHLLFEAEHMTKNGARIPVEINSHVFRLDGEPAVLSIVRDISKRKRVEKVLEQAHQTLEKRVEQRTAALLDANRKLEQEIEDRKRAEGRLRASEERFRQLAETIQEVFWIVSPDWKTLHYISPAYEKIWGLSRESLYQDPLSWLEALIPEDRDALKPHIQEIQVGDKTEVVFPEYRIRMPDGAIRWISARGFPVRDDSGTVVRVVGIAEDVTHRKIAAEAIREERDRAQQYLDIAGVILIALDPEGRVTLINRKGCEILGRKSGDIVGKNWFDEAVPQSSREDIESRFRQVIGAEIEGFEYYENPILTRDGGERIIAWHNTLLRNEKGEITATLSSGEDITDRKQAETALKQSEQRFRAIADYTHDWESWIGLDGDLIWTNPAVERVTGYTREEYSSSPDRLKRLVHEDDFDQVKEVIWNGLKKEQINNDMAFRIVRKDGELRWLSVSSQPIYDSEGVHLGLRSSLRDITDRKQAEEEKERLEDQLRQAQKMKALGTLAGGIAHDFNNILGAIIGYSEMLELVSLPKEDEKSRKHLAQILKAAHRAKDLVRQILTFSRRTDQEKKPVLIAPVIKETLKFLRASLPATVEIQHRIDDPDGTVMGDPTQIHQVLMNLCTNAGHAMGEGGGVLKVALAETQIEFSPGAGPLPELAPGPYLQLTVADTGPGMTPEVRERIFEPYFTTKEAGEGTGLGLAVTHGIIKAHGGGIAVNTRPGKGAVFDAYLPKIREKIAEHGMEEDSAPPRGEGRILFVDDEAPLVEWGKELLESLGYEVEGVTDSEEALKIWMDRPGEFDLVITDQTMPKMTGMELARRIRSVRSDAPVLLWTGFKDLVTANEAREIGIRELIPKPVRARGLAEAVRRVLETA